MGLGSTLTRAFIRGAIGVAKEVAKEEVRARHRNQAALLHRPVSVNVSSTAITPSVASHRKALRMVGIIEGLLEQTRDEWLPVFRESFGEHAPSSEIVQQNVDDSINNLAAYLKNKGFPYDKDVDFWAAVSDIHLELMLHKAFPADWREWNEDLDNTLERAAGEAKRIARDNRGEILGKVMPDGHVPADPGISIERLNSAVQQLFAQVILPALIDADLIRNNPLFMARFGSLIPKVVIRDVVEFSQELSQLRNGT